MKTTAEHRLDGIRDIPVTLSVELGRTRMRIAELLELGRGSIISLESKAGDLLEVFVSGRLIARGEAVVVNGHLGVRIRELLSAQPRPAVQEAS